MVLALGLGGVAALGLAASGSYLWFAAALALEGVSYGMFLTAGQAFVTHHVERENLGAAMGAYSTVGVAPGGAVAGSMPLSCGRPTTSNFAAGMWTPCRA